MSKIINNAYKERLIDYLTEYHSIVNLSRPFHCLNPEHTDNNPSMRYSYNYNICKCFSCGVSYDIYDLVGIDYGLSKFKDQKNKIKELYGDFIPQKNEHIYIENKYDYSKYYDECYENISMCCYLQERGIDSKLIKKYKIGYDKIKKSIVFPITKNCYFLRGVESSLKIKSKGISYLWNEFLLSDSIKNNLIYVTESIIDGLSIETIIEDAKVVSLNGASNYKRLLEVVKKNNYKGCLILALDNDNVGLNTQRKIKKELDKLNVISFSNTLISNMSDLKCKDINDALINNKIRLTKNLNYFDKNYNYVIQNIVPKEMTL